MNLGEDLCSEASITDAYTHRDANLHKYFMLEEKGELVIGHSFIGRNPRNISPRFIDTKPLYPITPLKKVLMHPITHLTIETHIRREHHEVPLWNHPLCFPDGSPDFDTIFPSVVVTRDDDISSDTDTLVTEPRITHDLTARIKAITIYMSEELLRDIEFHKNKFQI